jgi:hypothetical protein
MVETPPARAAAPQWPSAATARPVMPSSAARAIQRVTGRALWRRLDQALALRLQRAHEWAPPGHADGIA